MEFLGGTNNNFACILTYLAWRNGRWMKQAHQDSMEILVRIEKGQEEGRKEMAEVR